MLNQGFGMGTGGQAQEFERLARQYWAAWGDALRGTAPGAGQAGAHAWQDAIDWWTRYAHGGRSGINDVLERFNVQARDWYAQMQQVAAQFAGQDHSASDVARAWKQALGAAGANPFPEMLRSMRGQGVPGLDQWVEDARPWLDAVRGEGMAWLRMPGFGVGREHQERLQQLARSLVEYDESNSAYTALMLKASQRAFALFEDKLAAKADAGDGVESTRALFDLWIDAAEEAYAEIALSQEFRRAYGQLVDATMRVRAGLQREVEQACTTLGMPTRTEIDAAHRKIVELERALRRLRDAVEEGVAPASPRRPGGGRAGRPARADADVAPAAPRSSKGRPAAPKKQAVEAASKRAPAKAASAKPGQATQASGTSARPAAGKPAKPAAAKAGKPVAKTARVAKASNGARSGRQAKPNAAGAAKRPARKLAPRPSVSARRPPANAFASLIPIPDAPLPPGAPAAKRGAR